MARLMALLFDAIPAFIVVFGFLDGHARMFIDAIMLSLEQDQWQIYALMIAMICVWSLLWELAIGTSPGKVLFGARLIGGRWTKPLLA